MSNFKKLISDDIEREALIHYGPTSANDLHSHFNTKVFKAGATRYASLLEKALESLDFISMPINSNTQTVESLLKTVKNDTMKAKKTISEITAELTNKENE